MICAGKRPRLANRDSERSTGKRRLLKGTVGCTPIPMWAPYGKYLYKLYIMWVLMVISYNPQESHPRTPAKYHGAHTARGTPNCSLIYRNFQEVQSRPNFAPLVVWGSFIWIIKKRPATLFGWLDLQVFFVVNHISRSTVVLAIGGRDYIKSIKVNRFLGKTWCDKKWLISSKRNINKFLETMVVNNGDKSHL